MGAHPPPIETVETYAKPGKPRSATIERVRESATGNDHRVIFRYGVRVSHVHYGTDVEELKRRARLWVDKPSYSEGA